MTQTLLVLLALAALIAGLILIAWLKGTIGLASPRSRELLVLAGVPEWWYILGPFGAPLLVLAAALMIATPDARWARFFYGERKMHRAVEVHGLDSLTPTR